MESDIQLVVEDGKIKTLAGASQESSQVPTNAGDSDKASGKIPATGHAKKKKQDGRDLKLIMEPQNPSPTKYFDSDGIPLGRALEDGEIIPTGSAINITAGDNKKGGKIAIKCCNCSKVFTSRATYDVHFRSNYHQEPIYACPVCDKRIEQYRAYHLHCYRHRNSDTQRYTCQECAKIFHQKSDLVRHQNTHLPSNAGPSRERNGKTVEVKPPSVECLKCNTLFKTQADLKEHTRKTHPAPKQLVECPDCGKSLSAGGFYSHRKIHSESPKFSCQECGRAFVQKINLIQHHKTHNGNRPFQCDQCDKAFCEKAQLQRHLHHHSEERPFRCEVCAKCYKTERCLKVHSAVHTNERPYVCTECNKGFLSSSKLRQHSNIHSGLRPFKCKYCTRDFTNFPNWLKHIRRRHKVDHRTGEKLDSVPKFMTKKRPTEAAPKKVPTPGEAANQPEKAPKSGKSKKRTTRMMIPLPDVLKEESLPYVSESSNIDLNLVSKDDLLQPLTDEMEDIFKCLPSDESKLSIPDPLEPIGSSDPDPNEPQKFNWNQTEIGCDFTSAKTSTPEFVSKTLFQQEIPSNVANAPADVAPSPAPLLFDTQLPMFPAIISFCNDEQQFRIINPHYIHLSNTTFIAGASSKLPADSGSVSLPTSAERQK
ncbi:AGAP001555-PA-like protein [Anopheles sinensis]|uniref:AGAP001555-PA-like protein n=1 Tax=Anopheles sinensis TaxID=74873 RepID=A0A084VXC5_ANOSI|nr:AGAP001555-PA-like protein [Anopheles sinensis]